MTYPAGDLTGQQFNRLRVLGRAPNAARPKPRYFCLCACGTRTVVYGEDLRHGHTKSCGCLKLELLYRRSTTHGELLGNHGHPPHEYVVWLGAKQRCFNPKHPAYKNYGGRGITMCARWRNNYAAFLADMGRCPPGLTLDRRNNDRGYMPSNCHWATRKEQAANSRPKSVVNARDPHTGQYLGRLKHDVR